jgi:hypothetical protein
MKPSTGCGDHAARINTGFPISTFFSQGYAKGVHDLYRRGEKTVYKNPGVLQAATPAHSTHTPTRPTLAALLPSLLSGQTPMNSALTFSMSCTSLHSFLELPKTLSFLYFHMDQAVKITSVSNLCRSALPCRAPPVLQRAVVSWLS